MSGNKRWLITGAAGAIGLQVIKRLFKDDFKNTEVVASDVRPLPAFLKHHHLSFRKLDIRGEDCAEFIRNGKFFGILHLASIVSPGKNSNRDFEYSVDVLGTKNILEASVRGGVQQIIVTSSGAAYGYHQNLPDWIPEDEPVVGNKVFAYSWHKKLVEEMLADYQARYPELKQLILRPGTVLGDMMKNQITDLFEKPVVIGIRGSESPFVFIWDEDVAEIIYLGMMQEKSGIFNLAGDGKVTNVELAKILNKPLVKIPGFLLKGILALLKKLKLTQYGPDQLDFLKFRPVLDNRKLKTVFGYSPQYSSQEVLRRYLNPQRSFYLRHNLQKNSHTPLKIFTHHHRLDDLVWELSLQGQQAQDELISWLSYFESFRGGKIHLSQENANFMPSLKKSIFVKLSTSEEISRLKIQLSRQKEYQSIPDTL